MHKFQMLLHAEDENAFKYACINGHLEVAKWLLSLEPTHGRIIVNLNELLDECTNLNVLLDENIIQLLNTINLA